jgi:hypothetical protein
MQMHMLIDRKCNITSKIGKIPAAASLAVSASPFEGTQQNRYFVARLVPSRGSSTLPDLDLLPGDP